MIDTVSLRSDHAEAEDVFQWITPDSGATMVSPTGDKVPLEPSPKMAHILSGGIAHLLQEAAGGRNPWPYLVVTIDGTPTPVEPEMVFHDAASNSICVRFNVIDAPLSEVEQNGSYQYLDQKHLEGLISGGLSTAPAACKAKQSAGWCIARASDITEGQQTEPPDNIMWMPPGSQVITPSINGEARQMRIEVTAELAARLNLALQSMRSMAANGIADEPYIDFNHDDQARAAEVTELYWGGDDAKTGGIRARVIWSAAGEEAIRGRNYRRFSPEWQIDPDTNEPVGIGPNLGGLVNRAAFRTIAPVIARASAQASQRRAAVQGVQGKASEMIARAEDRADRKNIPLDEALRREMMRDPNFYAQYRNALMFGKTETSAQPRRVVSQAVQADYQEFNAAAEEYAQARQCSKADAMLALIRSNPAFMKTYRDNVVNGKGK